MDHEPGSMTLTEEDLRLVGLWASDCAERVLPLFEAKAPSDTRPREAIEGIRAFARGGEADCATALPCLGSSGSLAVTMDGRSRNTGISGIAEPPLRAGFTVPWPATSLAVHNRQIRTMAHPARHLSAPARYFRS
jgi:hypothetical protein